MAANPPSSSESSLPPLEIERSFLLRGMPPLPPGPPRPEVWRVAQGYLPEGAKTALGVEGRLRRIEHPDGRIEWVHTVKSGFGLVRTEVESPITEAEFDRLWPFTEGRRLTKTRYRVRPPSDVAERPTSAGAQAARGPALRPLIWEIDRFDGLDLVLAEVELPSADAPAPIPSWLEDWIVREVTESPEYRNSQIALRVHAPRAGRPTGGEDA